MEVVQEFTARIHYYCREGYYRQMQVIATEALQKFPSDSSFKLYNGFSLLFQKQISEAVRVLDPLRNEPRVSIGSILALIAAHRGFANVDSEEVATLESKLREGRKIAKPEELYFAGVFMSFSGKYDKAKEYLDRAIKHSNQQLTDAICLRGWVEIVAPTPLKEKGKPVNSPADYFQSVLATNRKHFESHLGLAKYFEMTRNFEQGREKLNALLGFQPNWIPALLEKMNSNLCTQDWEQALELANRVLSTDSTNLEANRFKILYTLCRDGDVQEAIEGLGKFFTLCKKMEPKNAKYFNENGCLFSQLGSFDSQILEESMKFAKYATELDVESEEYVTDVGRIYLSMKRYSEALNEFTIATKMNYASVSALYGQIWYQLERGSITVAGQQLSFLRELSASIEPSPELSFLAAILAKKEKQSESMVISNLTECVERSIQRLARLPYNITYLKTVNPELVIKIVREFLSFAPQEPNQGGQPSSVVQHASQILEMVTKVYPAHRDAVIINAQISYLNADFSAAALILQKLLRAAPNWIEAHLLLAQVQIAQEEYTYASKTLENVLSNNFKVRDYPKYHLLLAQVEANEGDYKKARKTLETGIGMLEELEKQDNSATPTTTDGSPVIEFNLSDKYLLYMELIRALRASNDEAEADRRMQEAFVIFKGTYLEGRLSLQTADDLLAKGDIPTALSLLKQVTPDQHHYLDAVKFMADIYFNHKKDPKAYTECFLQIVREDPSPYNLVLLGDAYIAIQDGRNAVKAYETSLTKSPKDPAVASKLCQALVKTHQFARAVSVYQDVIKFDENFPLRLELAKLQVNLEHWAAAEKTITESLIVLKDSSLSRLILEADLLTLLAKAQKGSGNFNQAQQSLMKAQETQSRVLKRCIIEHPAITDKMKYQFARICQLIGETAEKPSDVAYAVKSIHRGMEYCPEDAELLACLCKLYMRSGDFVHCQQSCQQLQILKPESEAIVMLGDLSYRRGDFPNSVLHYRAYLDKHPQHWESLRWFIEGVRRCGCLADAEPYIKRAANQCDPNEPGLGYCQGIYEWYNGNANSALKMLNKARRDPVYSHQAILLIVDIYLNPSSVVLGGEAFLTDSGDSVGNSADTKEITAKTVETLLREIVIRNPEDKFERQILECHALVATRNKSKMEKALQELSGLLTVDAGRESVMLVHAIATTYMLMKQVPRARTILKRIVKASWNMDDAEYLERCWLLLADIHIQASKYDLATDLIKKVLQFNKSCIKANEYLGLIMEKEQAYADAAINYEQAWKLSNSADPSIGYKLAFNYMKAKRFTDAIDVCHLVLAKNPNYPRIRKEILEKSRNSFRM